MKRIGGILCIIILLIMGLTVAPVMSSVIEANTADSNMQVKKAEEIVTLDFYDYTGFRPVKTTIELSQNDWNNIRTELRQIDKSTLTTLEILYQQITIFKKYNLISEEQTVEQIYGNVIERLDQQTSNLKFSKLSSTPLINNSVINAMCAIDFEMANGSTVVFGLNTFINWIGFDIISIHKGFFVNGIDTKGIFQQVAPAGEYVGFMFGFLGYWLGTMTAPGIYSDVTAAGFTVITVWLPWPLIPQ